MKEEIESVIDKARRAIQSSKREFNSGDFDYACSRAYYAKDKVPGKVFARNK